MIQFTRCIVIFISSVWLISCAQSSKISTNTDVLKGSNYVWLPTIEDFKFHGRDRFMFDYSETEGGVTVVRRIRKGPNYIGQFKKELEYPLTSASISFEVKFQESFQFPDKDHKLPLGLWGGEKRAKCLSGGCPPNLQDGFSVRLVESSGKPYLLVYSLNRSLSTAKKVYGAMIEPQGNYFFPTGEWITVTIEVIMNENIDGYDQLNLFVNSELIISNNKHKLRESEDWLLRGPLLTDLFGGLVDSPRSMSETKQRIIYREFKMKGKQ